MHSNKLFKGLMSIVAASAISLAAGSAEASEEFPAALAEVANMPCVPSCVVCHGKTPGDIGSFQARALPRALIASGSVPPPGAAGVAVLKSDFTAYAAKGATDPTIKAVVDALAAGKDPQTGDSLCGPTYGCGAHVAKKAPPSDLSAPLWVVGAMVVGGLLRRRKQDAS